jgi:hypothetical protein
MASDIGKRWAVLAFSKARPQFSAHLVLVAYQNTRQSQCTGWELGRVGRDKEEDEVLLEVIAGKLLRSSSKNVA